MTFSYSPTFKLNSNKGRFKTFLDILKLLECTLYIFISFLPHIDLFLLFALFFHLLGFQVILWFHLLVLIRLYMLLSLWLFSIKRSLKNKLFIPINILLQKSVTSLVFLRFRSSAHGGSMCLHCDRWIDYFIFWINRSSLHIIKLFWFFFFSWMFVHDLFVFFFLLQTQNQCYCQVGFYIQGICLCILVHNNKDKVLQKSVIKWKLTIEYMEKYVFF